MSVPDLGSLTVLKLKEICKGLGLVVSGKKADLVARIEAKRGGISSSTATAVVPAEEVYFPFDPELAKERVGSGGVSGAATVQNQIIASPTFSKKRKAGKLRELKSDVVDSKRGEKRGRRDKEALGGPIRTHPETTAQLPPESAKNVSVTGNDATMDATPKIVLALPSITGVNGTGNPGFEKEAAPIAIPYQAPASMRWVPETQILSTGLQPLVSSATAPGKQPPIPGKLVSAKRLSISIRPHESSMGTMEPESGLPKTKKKLESEMKPTITLVKKTASMPLTLEKAMDTSHPPKSPVALGMARESRTTGLENTIDGIVTEGKQLQKIPRALTPNRVGRGLGTFNTLFLPRSQPRFDRKGKNSFTVPRKKIALAMKPDQRKPLDPVEEPKSTEVESEMDIEALLPPNRQDTEINWRPIQHPPRVGFRKKVENISRVLALVAHHSSTLTSPAGTFLRNTVTLSKIWYYSSILAYYHLSLYEFGGKRTSEWIKLKRADITRADFREWYWHRVQQREVKMQMVKQRWWGERVWREYILANGLQREYGKHEDLDNGGLCCSGAIHMSLLNENETVGQWDVAARFWAGRFCAAMFSGKIEEGGRDMEMILSCGEYAVIDVYPVGENGGIHSNVSAGATISEVWEIVTKGAGAYIVVAGTGEVIGSLQAAVDIRRRGPGSSRSPMLRTGTTISTTGASKFRPSTNMRGHSTLHKLSGQWDDVSWHSLRLDWRAYVSKLLAYAAQPKPQGLRGATLAAYPQTPTIDPVPLLLSHLYHPSPKQFKHAIHENIALPHHRVIAERFILAHAEEYGFSGGAGNPISGGKKVGIDVDSKWRVESVVGSGEKMKTTEGRVKSLGNGVVFVQTAEGGWYVLEDTGEIIAQEEYGISGIWAAILGVDERGFEMGRKGFLELMGLFRSSI